MGTTIFADKNQISLLDELESQKDQVSSHQSAAAPVVTNTMNYSEDANTPKEQEDSLSVDKLIELREYLANFTRHNIPSKYFVAYKILVLGSAEYEGIKNRFLQFAYHDMIFDKSRNVIF